MRRSEARVLLVVKPNNDKGLARIAVMRKGKKVQLNKAVGGVGWGESTKFGNH